ncbi:glycosyltransferase family 4 protein [Natribaculum luteum]|uniref:Glycosyltransferase family 4 protein n=1 Tax=Natribaculum luteum TaxID=1586232 RepID=A0ABD5NV46_9EURY
MLLLHTNREYAETLADAVTESDTDFEPLVVSRQPLLDRLKTLLTADIDLIQADELMVNGMLAAGASLVRQIPLVVSIRGWADYTNAHNQYGSLRERSIELRSKATLQRTKSTLFISEITEQAFKKRYNVCDATIVGRPIDIEAYADGTQRGRNTFDVLTVTNLRYKEKYKGVVMTLQAMEPLFEEYPSLRFRIAGSGPYLEKLKKFLQTYNYSNRISLLGFVDAIADEYASADLFVYVSFLDSYATVILEAQAAGLPVIGSDAVGIPETVGNGGMLCDPTVEGIQAALEHVISDDDLRYDLERRAQQKIATHNAESAAAHIDVWERVLTN